MRPIPFAALAKLHACHDATEWLRARQDLSWDAAWDDCPDGSWSLWLICRLDGAKPFGSPELRRHAACSAEIVTSLAQPFWPEAHRETLQRGLDLLIKYGNGGEVTQEEMRSAASAAFAAASAASAASAAYAAYAAYAFAAASAAYAAYAAYAFAAASAAFAAASAASAASAALAAASAGRRLSLEASAEIVRAHYPIAPDVGVV